MASITLNYNPEGAEKPVPSVLYFRGYNCQPSEGVIDPAIPLQVEVKVGVRAGLTLSPKKEGVAADTAANGDSDAGGDAVQSTINLQYAWAEGAPENLHFTAEPDCNPASGNLNGTNVIYIPEVRVGGDHATFTFSYQKSK